jgi:hypothetical protein
MKAISKTLGFSLVIALAGAGGQIQSVIGAMQVAQTQRNSNNKWTPLALPDTADVKLKDKTSLTVKVSRFDSSKQTMVFTRSNQSRTVKFNDIQLVTFRRNAMVYRCNGSPNCRQVIRGQDNAKAQQSIWPNIAFNFFQLVDPNRGQANVDLSTVLPTPQLRGVRAVAVKSLYVVDEIQFLSAGKMTIKVTPTDK